MISRRNFMKTTAVGGATFAVGRFPTPAIAQNRPIKIGFVSPETGPLAVFTEPDQFVVGQFKAKAADGLAIGGSKRPLEIIVKDSQSNSNRASAVAQELILNDKVDIIVASATPDTTNPVADQAELNGVPCVTNDTPWQPHFFGRNGNPQTGFQYTYHFFWGLEDVIDVFMSQWGGVETNKVVGVLWPNDPDGNGWSDPKLGFPPIMEKAGFKLIDPGRYQNLSDDFSAQISAFKQAGVEVVSGVMIPPDFTTFWTQAAQQGFRPKVVNVAKASEFPQAMDVLGGRAKNLSVEVWWHRKFPFASSFTGQSCDELAAAYEKASGKVSTMSLGAKHSLFEVALDALRRADDIDSPDSIAKAIKETRLQTVLGFVDFSKGPVPNVAKTPLAGGQWQFSNGKPSLEIVKNSHSPEIPLTAEMQSIA